MSFDVTAAPGIKVPPGYTDYFKSIDGKQRTMIAEATGGPTWYTEFNVLTGLSARSFGDLKFYVTRIAAGRRIDCGRQHVGGHLRRAPDHEGVVRRDLGRQVPRRQTGPDVDLEVAREQLETLRGQRLGHQYLHAPSAPWKTCSAAATAAPSLTG